MLKDNNEDRKKRRVIYDDTSNLCDTIPKLSEAIDRTIKNTRFYPHDKPIPLPEKNYSETKITVTDERSIACAARLHLENPHSRIAVLNFASPKNPSPEIWYGYTSQESSLCLCSILFYCLIRNQSGTWSNFYYIHSEQRDLRYTDTCIYSPDVIAFKTDTKYPMLMAEEDWFKVDIISCAAPNLRNPPYARMKRSKVTALILSDEEQFELHYKRAEHILRSAAANGAERLVLGAFGCGGLKSNPYIVAEAYKELIPKYKGYFKEICFAVYCEPADMTNYRVFREVLGGIQ